MLKTVKKMLGIAAKHRILITAGTIIFIIGLGIYAVLNPQPAKYTYITQPVQEGTLINDVSGTGNLAYAQSSAVNSQVSGTVSAINVSQGDTVTAGESLFSISNPSLSDTADKLYATYLKDKSSVSGDQTLIIQDQNNLNNDNASIATDQQPTASPSQQQALANAQQQQAVDSRQLATAQLALTADLANELADWSAYSTQLTTINEENVVSPINGMVASINVAPGQNVSGSAGGAAAANNPEILIVSPSSLDASITLNEVDAVKVQTGQTVQLSFNAIPGLSLTGTVASISPLGTISQGVVTYSATVALSVANPQLKSGMSVSANITTEAKNNVISVPSTAIKTNSSGGQYVQILSKGKPLNVDVQTGIVTNNGTEITHGLSVGEAVITQTISSKLPKSLSSPLNGSNLLKLNGGGSGRGGAKAHAGKL